MFSDRDQGAVWRVVLVVPKFAAEGFAEGLEARFPAISWFMPDDTGSEIQLEALSTQEPIVEDLKEWVAEIADALGVRAPEVDITWLPSRDWVAENRKSFEPFSVGRFFMHGAEHCSTVPPGKIAIEVEAGLAFGSGRHESTAGCLQALSGLVPRRVTRPLDMGCGSGILSVAMAKAWRAPVVAADIDPAAVQVARENARLNGVGSRVRTLVGNGYESPALKALGPFDLIVANILAAPLCRMAMHLARNLSAGGIAVLAGFVAAEERRVFVAHRRCGLNMIRSIDMNGWRTLVLKKPGRGKDVSAVRPARPGKSRPE
ncbi:MAG: 50S ribosomal protein L11 methyltransferase [Rhodospirillales bacterium]|nr:50S ribosomal protein L11 methyltransferase [Rhodospirillales bacterium]